MVGACPFHIVTVLVLFILSSLLYGVILVYNSMFCCLLYKFIYPVVNSYIVCYSLSLKRLTVRRLSLQEVELYEIEISITVRYRRSLRQEGF